ncbi:uronyl 2-sulfotransferase-like [Tigriopus californicus]|uniref:uronyl 2-sulfotransferase-like n=1 Tax=Tigriopus californicus TaxID=6832 RepID=UPI0027DA9AD0|nr:uronyl 2-sulfotransferase-like [Tigriopus californicus]
MPLPINSSMVSTDYRCWVLLVLGVTFLLTSVLNYLDNSLLIYERVNSTQEPQIDQVLVVYDLVPRVSDEFSQELQVFGRTRRAKFNVVELNHKRKVLSRKDQEKLVKTVWSLNRPVAVMDSVRFVDFSNFSSIDVRPLYFALVEHPVSKFIDWYQNFMNAKSTSRIIRQTFCLGQSDITACVADRLAMDVNTCLESEDIFCRVYPEFVDDLTIIPSFCGHLEQCEEPKSSWALQMAKFNVEKWFPAIGVAEKWKETLIVASKRIPSYFQDIMDFSLWYQKERTNSLLQPSYPDPWSRLTSQAQENLKTTLKDELEFYEYLKQRIIRQAILSKQ